MPKRRPTPRWPASARPAELSHIAAIMNDMHRAAGRSGVGAVMGSKNLKAVVVRGTGAVRVADKAGFLDTVASALPVARKSRVTSRYGTGANMNPMNAIGGMPTANFQETHFATADKVSGEALTATLLLRAKACFACPIACGRVTKVNNPKYRGEGEGPEYETAFAFGPDCFVDDLEAVTKAGYICNEMGLDTISMGGTVACAMELFQRGIIAPCRHRRPAAGIRQRRGDGRGRAADRARGRVRQEVATRLMAVGQPLRPPGTVDDLQEAGNPGLRAAINPGHGAGICHLQSRRLPRARLHRRRRGVRRSDQMDNNATEGKAAFLVGSQNFQASLNSTGGCNMAGRSRLRAICGADDDGDRRAYDGEGYFKAGERIWNLERLWNLKAGLTAADDTLPPRMLNDPIPKGPSKGAVNRLGEMMPEYYRLHRWGPDGVPTPEKLAELALNALNVRDRCPLSCPF